MSSSPTQPSQDRTGVKRMLVIFAILAVAGVLMFLVSAVLGLAILVVAEVFFAIAYRRFSRLSKPPG
ncbi:MAG: hypothetical protein JRN23_02050 [Nitrososphaerota archaeon]|nr:hypothetical protein [Nitrososphaerota archaeon]MDG6967188.1 hypothetical protein [Nitrososphaerota archaeon]MDG6978823.1 hypothetical protein [Nitrososphaerota archaeon]MDG7020697.1 hypothetical protein [Nitrososphaerota archaeon]